MDWDGIGVFALFLASGAVGLGVIGLKAYGLHLKSRLDRERIKHDHGASADVTEELAMLEQKVDRLTDRLDFTERLLASGEGRGSGSPDSPSTAE